jgi:MFS family permease
VSVGVEYCCSCSSLQLVGTVGREAQNEQILMPLYAVLARENFPLRMMGTIIGGTAMAGSLGMATGPLAGGFIYDTFASYGWLYIGAWGIGIDAFWIALTFRPYAAKPTPELARAA